MPDSPSARRAQVHIWIQIFMIHTNLGGDSKHRPSPSFLSFRHWKATEGIPQRIWHIFSKYLGTLTSNPPCYTSTSKRLCSTLTSRANLNFLIGSLLFLRFQVTVLNLNSKSPRFINDIISQVKSVFCSRRSARRNPSCTSLNVLFQALLKRATFGAPQSNTRKPRPSWR
jgi:hypothetical protein